MIDGLTYFREINFFSVFLRMACAMVCGGIIGTEREYKRRSAGFRTHILICAKENIKLKRKIRS